MFTLYSTQELHDFVDQHYSSTSRQTGHYDFVITALGDFSVPFGESLVEHCSGVNTVKTLEVCRSAVSAVKTLIAPNFGSFVNEFDLVLEQINLMEKNQSTTRAKYLAPQYAKDYFNTIKSPVGRALQCLAYTAGVTPEALVRPTTDLRAIHLGAITVGTRLSSKNTAAREVIFDQTLLNELDPEGEVVGVLLDVARQITADNAGVRSLSKLGKYTAGCEFDLLSLRNSHAVNLLNEGYSDAEVAELQGVSVEQLRDRIKNFKRNAGIE